jgi:hypothetical protein
MPLRAGHCFRRDEVDEWLVVGGRPQAIGAARMPGLPCPDRQSWIANSVSDRLQGRLLLEKTSRLTEAKLNRATLARRNMLKLMAAAGGIGLSAARTFRSGAAQAAGVTAYDPAATFDLAVSEVELRRNSAGRVLMARIYQPKGPGPFPTVLDLHGGAWNRKDRFAEEPMDRALAASGLLVVPST